MTLVRAGAAELSPKATPLSAAPVAAAACLLEVEGGDGELVDVAFYKDGQLAVLLQVSAPSLVRPFTPSIPCGRNQRPLAGRTALPIFAT